MTNYYIRKYIYLGWNKDDDKVQTMPKSIFFMRWTHMCLIFAEAANRVSGPTAELYGYTPKQAHAYLRSRPTNDGIPGVGATADPYLDECAAAGPEEFEKLVRNERRIELCFEQLRYFDTRRWLIAEQTDGGPFYGMNVDAGNSFTDEAFYEKTVFETRVFLSLIHISEPTRP